MKAEETRTPIGKLSAAEPELEPAQAYRIQREVAQRRTDNGEQLVGLKVGLTSRAMQQMSGVMQPDFGHLFAAMAVADGAIVETAELMQPAVEAELAYVLAEPLEGPGVSAADVLRATAFVCPALEIVDTRFDDWKIRWVDTVADNGSSARFVLGDNGVDPKGLDLEMAGLVFERNGSIVSTAALAEVMGHPTRAVAWLANALAEYGTTLPAGSVVLSGAPCRAVAVEPGDHFRVRIDRIGTAAVTFR
ncbi:2-keto-4-pentenoate hydratase [Streptomyces sp. NBC_00258]|uniref:2-keto-4-pentenoate hydratase n=1 Tax=Streptomyces sp. NBC_00258 TaxID=2903642 RepID=UPI002E28AE3D|nr:fumarylacetoacetate hydrolase family protein [Streptomyces sp. NBC_00258]